MAGKESVEDILASIRKKTGASIGKPSEILEPVEGLSTGNLAVDYITGVGGIPVGRITELYGNPASGKTTTAVETAATLQKRIIAEKLDQYILYEDFEHALDLNYVTALGLDVEHPSFILAQPHWLEEGAQIVLDLVTKLDTRLVIFDSVAEMTPKALIDGDFDQRTGAMNRARLMKELLMRITPLIHQRKTAAIFLNHLMEDLSIGGRPGMPPIKSTPGGKGLKYYSSLRMEYTSLKQVKSSLPDFLTGEPSDQVVAVETKVKVTKNKIGFPAREALVRVIFGKGFDNFWSAFEILKAQRRIVVANPGYHFFERTPELIHPDMPIQSSGKSRSYIQGKENVLRFADEHPEWRDKCINIVKEILDKASSAEAGTADAEIELVIEPEIKDITGLVEVVEP